MKIQKKPHNFELLVAAPGIQGKGKSIDKTKYSDSNTKRTQSSDLIRQAEIY